MVLNYLPFYKIFTRTGTAFMPFSFLYLSPIFIIFPEYVYLWAMFSIIFMQSILLHPLGAQKLLTKIIFLTNYPVKRYLRSFNLFLAFVINLCCAILLLFPVIIEKISLHTAFHTLLLMNTMLFTAFTLGNSLELSDFSTVKYSILKKVAENILLSLAIFAVFMCYMLFSIFLNDNKLLILSGLLAISLILWHISLNKINRIKYFHYL